MRTFLKLFQWNLSFKVFVGLPRERDTILWSSNLSKLRSAAHYGVLGKGHNVHYFSLTRSTEKIITVKIKNLGLRIKPGGRASTWNAWSSGITKTKQNKQTVIYAYNQHLRNSSRKMETVKSSSVIQKIHGQPGHETLPPSPKKTQITELLSKTNNTPQNTTW